MKRWGFLMIGLILPGLAAAEAAPANVAATALPFGPGERLSYEITLLGLRAGEAEFEVESDFLEPGTLKLLAKGRSVGTADSLFRLRQSATCVVEQRTMALRVCRVATSLRTGDRRREFTVDRSKRAIRERLLQDGKPREKIHDMGDGIDRVQEALSGLYLLRTRLPDDGTPLRFTAFRKGKPITVEARAAGLTTIATPAGTYQAREVKLAVVEGEGEAGETAGSLWFSADTRRLPVKLSFDAKVGKLEAHLQSASGTLAAVPAPPAPALQAAAARR